MIVALAFGPPVPAGERRLREARFVARSTVPVSALCLVANGVREHLRAALGVPLEITLGEAAPLCAAARARLFDGAHCFVTRGRATDVFLFVSERDARRLLAVAFQERAVDCSLSPLERSALGRLVCGLAAVLDPLCAERQAPAQAVDVRQAARCTTYVDLRIGPPVEATLGLGLTREPAADASGPTLAPEHILGVECDVRAEIARGTITAAQLARLGPGEIVRMNTKVGAQAVLKVAELIVARGRGGVVVGEDAISGPAAFAVDSV